MMNPGELHKLNDGNFMILSENMLAMIYREFQRRGLIEEFTDILKNLKSREVNV